MERLAELSTVEERERLLDEKGAKLLEYDRQLAEIQHELDHPDIFDTTMTPRKAVQRYVQLMGEPSEDGTRRVGGLVQQIEEQRLALAVSSSTDLLRQALTAYLD